MREESRLSGLLAQRAQFKELPAALGQIENVSMQNIGEVAFFAVLVLTAMAVLLPFAGCLLYFLVQRMRANDDNSRGRYRHRRNAFKRFVNRMIVLLICLFTLGLISLYAQARWLGAVSGWGFGVFGLTGVELVLLALFAFCGAYLGYALANVRLPGAALKD